MQPVTLLTVMLALTVAAGQPASQPAAQRFDYLVRGDFFAGIAGDEARLNKAIDLCERTLAENPNHPEALVWHGAATLVQSGQAFRKGDLGKGGELWARGLEEMNRAVALTPDNVGVLIPRGATLLEATRNLKPDAERPLIESAVANYERVSAVKTPYLSTLRHHAKG